jgi:hypothetical protein
MNPVILAPGFKTADALRYLANSSETDRAARESSRGAETAQRFYSILIGHGRHRPTKL